MKFKSKKIKKIRYKISKITENALQFAFSQLIGKLKTFILEN